MAPTWSKSPRASLSADLTPAESFPAPLSAGPGSGEETELGKKKKKKENICLLASTKNEAWRRSYLVCQQIILEFLHVRQFL